MVLVFLFAGKVSASSCCVDQGSIVHTIAGTGVGGYSGDGGPAVSAKVNADEGIALDPAGNIYFSDAARMRKIDPSGVITTVIGNGSFTLSGDGGPGTSATMWSATGMKWHNGLLYFCDELNHEIRTYDPVSGIVDRICGNGTNSSTGDGGLAMAATVKNPRGIDFDVAGNLYFADIFANRIRKIDTGGIITTIAGTGATGYAADGSPAISSPIYTPESLAIMSSGEIVYYEDSNRIIRKIDSSGNLQTIAGVLGTPGYSGDGGPAVGSKVGDTEAMTWGCGRLFFGDDGGARVRTIDSAGMITTVAGTGALAYSGDGMPAGVTSLNPGIGSLAVDALGNLYIAAFNRVLKVSSGCTPTPTPCATPTLSASLTVTTTPTESPTATLSPTPTLTATVTVSPSATPTFSASPTFSRTPSPSASPTITLTPTPYPTLTPTPLPLFLKLLPPSPNPASDEVWIPFHLSTDADVDIDVFTVAGERVRHLGKQWTVAGYAERRWDLHNEADTHVASGIFIYRVRAVSTRNEEKSDFSKCAVVR
jgi:hypothetical protein